MVSTLNYAKTLELYVQECIRQLLQGRSEEEIKEEARKALGNYLNDQDKEVFLNKMLARAKVRLLLSKVYVEPERMEDLNTKAVNMLHGSRSSNKHKEGSRVNNQ
jgi:hypothetical protein